MGSERSEGVGNTGWWKNHMYQWGLERRSDNIDVLWSGAGALRISSGVAPERSEVDPESLVSVTSDQSIYDFYFKFCGLK